MRFLVLFVLAVLPFTFPMKRAAAADTSMAPKVDHSATYRVDPEGYVITMSHHGGKIRMDMTQEGYEVAMLMEPLAHRMIMLMQGMAIAMDTRMPGPGISAKPGLNPGDVVSGSGLTSGPLGTKVIAGVQCTVYEAVCRAGGEESHSRVCLTADNVMLESISTDPGKEFSMVATAVTIAPQDPSLFEVPPGTPVTTMDQMIQGMGGVPPVK